MSHLERTIRVNVPQDSNRKFAGHIDVRHVGNEYHLTIDGEEFPWFIASDGATVTVSDDEAPSVVVRILAERVTVDHTFG